MSQKSNQKQGFQHQHSSHNNNNHPSQNPNNTNSSSHRQNTNQSAKAIQQKEFMDCDIIWTCKMCHWEHIENTCECLYCHAPRKLTQPDYSATCCKPDEWCNGPCRYFWSPELL